MDEGVAYLETLSGYTVSTISVFRLVDSMVNPAPTLIDCACALVKKNN